MSDKSSCSETSPETIRAVPGGRGDDEKYRQQKKSAAAGASSSKAGSASLSSSSSVATTVLCGAKSGRKKMNLGSALKQLKPSKMGKKMVNMIFRVPQTKKVAEGVVTSSGVGEASIYHALVVIFLEFFAWGLLTSPMITGMEESN